MAAPTFNAIGFCANYSKQGDWAFDFALELSKQHNVKLNVFYFLSDPYNPDDEQVIDFSDPTIDKFLIEEEKKLRLYYDERAGEYLDIGFRVCYDDSWLELHRCLLIREFQLLILAVPKKGTYFAKKPIKEFADSFISPLILVGPENKKQLYFNTPARLMSQKLETLYEIGLKP